MRLEQLVLPTRVSSLLLSLLLGVLLGGGSHILLQTSIPSHRELPSWRSETLKRNGPSALMEKSSKSVVHMKTDFARLNGSSTNTGNETNENYHR